jgi:hypothetical protein
MNARNLALGIFVASTVVFASLTAGEYLQVNSLSSQIRSVQGGSMTSTSTTCTYTGPAVLECPHFFNQTYTVSVSYGGPWGASYQGYLGDSESGPLVESGSFFGHTPANESVTVTGTDTSGITICAEAQKLDASNSTLVLRILPPINVMNQTVLAYGTTKACLADVIV